MTAHLDGLNERQYEAVTSIDGPVLVLAGAGSGKTRVLTRRIAHLLDLGVDPESVLAVTFTNKAAAEMKERVIDLVGPAGEKVWVSTFHSTCGRILRKDIEALGWTRRFTIYDDDDQLRTMRQLLADHDLDPKTHSPGRYLSRIDHYKNRLMTPTDVVEQKRLHRNDPLIELWDEYEQSLLASDAVDFNDLIGLVVRLFENHPEILEQWQEKFRYILVDEYQDTNHAQYRVLQALAAKHSNLCCVGDDDQSIYGFRGADIRNILDFQQDYPDALIIRMEQNYRCSKNILSVANAVVAKNAGRIEKELFTDASPGPRVNLLMAERGTQEAQLVAAAIGQLKNAGAFDYGDMAILYRSNRTSQPLEKALTLAQIPHFVVGGQSFVRRREIRDILAYLRLIVNPADDASFLRVCNVPTRGIGAVTIRRLRDEATQRGEPLLATARVLAQGSNRTARSLAAFIKLIDELAGLARDVRASALVRELLKRSEYDAMLLEEGTKDAQRRMKNLDTLVQMAATVEPSAVQGPVDALQSWLDTLSLSSADDEETPTSRVSLMTVHTSKGLEFPVVFVVQMNEGSFPHAKSLEDGGVEEERRLAYVAFTRAKQRLVVTRSRRLSTSGSRVESPSAPSRFLFNLPTSSIAGEIPELKELVDDGLGGPGAEVVERFMRGHGATTAPTGEHREIHSLSQLSPGTAVFHPELGHGTVRHVAGSGTSARAKVTFAGRRTITIPLSPCPLRLVESEPQPTLQTGEGTDTGEAW